MNNSSESQLLAIESPINQNALVISGPGSGKTLTLTERYRFLRTQAFGKDKIILLTFTNKAAKEMMRRISDISDYNDEFTGTFHHFAYRIIRRTNKDFVVLNESRQIKLLKSIIKKNNFEDESAGEFVAIYSKARNSMTPLNEVPELESEVKETLISEYETEKRKRNLLDFDDLLSQLLLTIRDTDDLFSNEMQVLVDEFQDTNHLQIEILDGLKKYNCRYFVVGDSNQSIFGFRAANIGNILTFQDRFAPVTTYHLGQNFRSTQEIIAPYSEFIQLNSSRIPIDLFSSKKGPLPTILKFADNYQEAATIAKIISNSGDYGNTAILYRANFQSPPIEKMLLSKRIPFLVKGKIRFFEQPHTSPVIDLGLLLKTGDARYLTAILTLFDRIGPKTAEKIALAILSKQSNDIVSAIPTKNASQELLDFIGVIGSELDYKAKIANFVYQVLIPYTRFNLSDPDRRKEDIDEVLRCLEGSQDLQDFLSYAALDDNHEEEADNSVLLSTIHAAKGLEWKTVFVAGITHNIFPHHKSLLENQIEEERRLLYVAMSRAKDHLWLSFVGWSTFLRELNPSFFR